MNLRYLLSLLLAISLTSVDGANHMQLFWNLYGAVVRGTKILHDVTQGVGAVTKAITAIDTFLDTPPEGKEDAETTATEANPIDEAANPIAVAKIDAALSNFKGDKETPFNGCGALGFHIRDDTLPVESMTECCITHDKCYNASCKVKKRDCDYKLRSCLFSRCDQVSVSKDKSIQKTCRSAAHILFSGTMALSFKQFDDAHNSQQCHKKKKSKKSKKK